jgi:uncharacterized membrane protein
MGRKLNKLGNVSTENKFYSFVRFYLVIAKIIRRIEKSVLGVMYMFHFSLQFLWQLSVARLIITAICVKSHAETLVDPNAKVIRHHPLLMKAISIEVFGFLLYLSSQFWARRSHNSSLHNE